MEEVWKQNPKYPKLDMSTHGRVRYWYFRDEKHKPRLLRPVVSGGNPYKRFQHTTDGRALSLTLHREIARTFLPDFREGLVVNHKDGNKTNNHLSNLEMVTQKQNMQHACRMGLMPDRSGERAPRAKLTLKQVKDIRSEPTAYGVCVKLARKYGVSRATINQIRCRYIWKKY